MRRRGSVARSVALAAATLMVAGGTALGALRLGTDGADILVGTSGGDFFRPKGGADVLRGLAGNDVYEFENGWGRDAVEEKARYKVDGKTVPGGKDTLSFAKVTNSGIGLILVRQWDRNYAFTFVDDAANRVDLGSSSVEKVVGSPATDHLTGGGEANLLDGGGGPGDQLYDYGGWRDGADRNPGLPASSDTFAGVAANTAGMAMVQDWGGSADVVDLRPLRLADVYIDRIQSDGDPEVEGLQIVTGPDQWVWIPGQFGEYLDRTERSGQHGQIEKLVFADVTIDAGEVAGLAAASARAGGDGKNRTLAAAADRLADHARTTKPEELPGVDAAWPGVSEERFARHRAAERGDGDGSADARDGGRRGAGVAKAAGKDDEVAPRGAHGGDRAEGGGKEKHDRDLPRRP
jgi:hypothetical protein